MPLGSGNVCGYHIFMSNTRRPTEIFVTFLAECKRSIGHQKFLGPSKFDFKYKFVQRNFCALPISFGPSDRNNQKSTETIRFTLFATRKPLGITFKKQYTNKIRHNLKCNSLDLWLQIYFTTAKSYRLSDGTKRQYEVKDHFLLPQNESETYKL